MKRSFVATRVRAPSIALAGCVYRDWLSTRGLGDEKGAALLCIVYLMMMVVGAGNV